MAEKPLVSIVTPSYNGVRFIERCIESVLSQDYPYVEHIVQDGASTDGTVDILKKYTGRVDWVSEPDNGQSDGLNQALQRCRGDIIGVLNADDEYLPHAATWAVENFKKFPDMAVIYGDQYDVDSDGVILHKTYGQPYNFEKVFCVEYVIPAQAAFISKTHFEQVGLGADVTRKTCPDYEMWVRIGMKFPMQYVPGFVAKYRCHPGSEGQQASLIPEFVRAKREVMDRVFHDPTTLVSMKVLRRRAYSGVTWWGACIMIGTGGIRQGIKDLLPSLWVYPSLAQISRLAFFFAVVEFYCKPRQRIWRILSWIAAKSFTWLERVCRVARILR
jgi:glycosyltransferase involved in cell wall biosynthesis